MIEITGLRVAYGRTVAIHGLDLELVAGVTGLFGPNGAGKSTLLRVLAGLLRPAHGRVLLDGVELRASNEAIRRRIGYAGHQTGLYARLSLQENLELFGSLYGVAPGRASEVVEQAGLQDRATTPVGDLSAGLKRRAAVCRALLHEPDLLLLDEPYANLDDEGAELLSGAVKAWRSPDRIALIATHGAKRVKAFADAGIIIQNGRVVSYRRRVPDPDQVAAREPQS
ncbi:MAG: heme ABC exporter ATP-binding protein CcmA [Actinomycetota bacterium]